MKKLVIVLVLGMIILSCSNGSDEPISGVFVDIGVHIKYLDENGNNLLNGEIDESDINIYHKINNEWVKYYEGNLDYPKGIMIYERENEKYLVLFVSEKVNESNLSETKIEFSNYNESDIVKTEIDFSNNNIIVRKVWYNGIMKWESTEQTERMFEIVK
ncbi:MAG: hypothetical protein J7K34_05045 [Flavobacteriaceae bacterium]|nr:hypothetical protein [Flavobacteriaceae bacterium]